MVIGNVGPSLFVFLELSIQLVYILLFHFLEDVGREVELRMVFKPFSVRQIDHRTIGAIPMEVRSSQVSSSSSTSASSPMVWGIVSAKMTPTLSLTNLVNCSTRYMVGAKLRNELSINFIPESCKSLDV